MSIPNSDELQLIGKYVVGLFRLKYFVVAGYVASNTFESIINVFLKWQNNSNIDYDNHMSLDEKIKAINLSLLNNRYELNINFGKLINLKKTRNDIVHGFIRDINPKAIRDIVEFIWEVVAKTTENKAERNIDLIDIKTAQYWVRDFETATDEKNVQRQLEDQKIAFNDFQDLYKMRNKFLELITFLDVRKRLGKYPNFTIDDISAVNTTSAYVWLAIVDRRGEPRRKINGPSISVLATPLDLRIYLDFGGLAFEHRKNYFQFLQMNELEFYGINTTDLHIFDIDWYSFISNRRLYKEYIKTPDFKIKANVSYDMVDNINTDAPLTWNRMLIGYIIDRSSTEDDKLTFNIIWNKICEIIKLYKVYQSSSGIEMPKQKIASIARITELQNVFNR